MWSRVNGLMSNTIVTLYRVGWQPSHYHVWHDRQRNEWRYQLGLSTLPVIIAIQDDVVSDMWRKASHHRNGSLVFFRLSVRYQCSFFVWMPAFSSHRELYAFAFKLAEDGHTTLQFTILEILITIRGCLRSIKKNFDMI